MNSVSSNMRYTVICWSNCSQIADMWDWINRMGLCHVALHSFTRELFAEIEIYDRTLIWVWTNNVAAARCSPTQNPLAHSIWFTVDCQYPSSDRLRCTLTPTLGLVSTTFAPAQKEIAFKRCNLFLWSSIQYLTFQLPWLVIQWPFFLCHQWFCFEKKLFRMNLEHPTENFFIQKGHWGV